MTRLKNCTDQEILDDFFEKKKFIHQIVRERRASRQRVQRVVREAEEKYLLSEQASDSII